MKKPRPGQYVSVSTSDIVYRAKKRTYGCNGCVLNNPLVCPNVKDRRFEQEPEIDCIGSDIILVNVGISI